MAPGPSEPFRVDLRTRLRQCDVRHFMQCDPVALTGNHHGWWASFQSGKSMLHDSVDGVEINTRLNSVQPCPHQCKCLAAVLSGLSAINTCRYTKLCALYHLAGKTSRQAGFGCKTLASVANLSVDSLSYSNSVCWTRKQTCAVWRPIQ